MGKHEIDPQELLDRYADASLASRLGANSRRQLKTDNPPPVEQVRVLANILYRRRIGDTNHPEKYRGHNQNTDWQRAQLGLIGAPRELTLIVKELADGKSLQEIKNSISTANFLRNAPIDLPTWDDM